MQCLNQAWHVTEVPANNTLYVILNVLQFGHDSYQFDLYTTLEPRTPFSNIILVFVFFPLCKIEINTYFT